MINSCTYPYRGYDDGSCIDHIFIKSNLKSSAGKLMNLITDHYPVFISLFGNNIKCFPKVKNEINKKRFISLCKIEQWHEIYEITDLEDALELLIRKIDTVYNKSIKIIPKTQKSRKCWITPALINSVNEKNKLYKIWKSDICDNVKKEQYLQYERRLNNVLQSAKNRYDQKLIQGADTKKMWQYVNNRLDKNTRNHQIGDIVIGNLLYQDDLSKANHFNL